MDEPILIDHHETTPAELQRIHARQQQEQLNQFSASQKQEVKRFLVEKANEFISKSQAVPCTRKSRRQAAREIAKRYYQQIRSEETQVQNANV